MSSPNARGALTPARDHAPPTTSRAGKRSAPLVIPELHELARVVRPADLESVRLQVSPGDRVAIYLRRGREARMLIIGPARRHLATPIRLDGEWRIAGEVLISDDREESLAGEYVPT